MPGLGLHLVGDEELIERTALVELVEVIRSGRLS